MAHHKSTRKRVRLSAKQRLRNRAYISALRTSLKKLDVGIQQRQTGQASSDDVMTLFRQSQSHLMRCVTKNRLKKNTASRKIKRLAHKVKTACLSS